ncbi:hypothetical protein [Pedococcus sp. 5OH_020]|uniref:hypothetical protein n=1 Tax=Pedococcus sp. 5OH_020 TaxID=2989814 RepID=UPI0022E9C281|nr:hypothetical protein [Pedococcus sp. 5OH_020]
MRNRTTFRRAEAKVHALKAAGEFSLRDGPGAKVAVLMPFVAGLVQDQRDDYASFESDAQALVAHIEANDREPVLHMRATVADFESAMTDPTIPTVILRGFGNLSAISTPREAGPDAPYTVLEWSHLAAMADHLKLGKFVMRSCGGMTRIFNPPLGYGVVASHRDILAPVGLAISVVGLDDPVNDFIRPVTETEQLTREDILSQFPLQRLRDVPEFIPDSVYVGARALHFLFSDPYAGRPRPTR